MSNTNTKIVRFTFPTGIVEYAKTPMKTSDLIRRLICTNGGKSYIGNLLRSFPLNDVKIEVVDKGKPVEMRNRLEFLLHEKYNPKG